MCCGAVTSSKVTSPRSGAEQAADDRHEGAFPTPARAHQGNRFSDSNGDRCRLQYLGDPKGQMDISTDQSLHARSGKVSVGLTSTGDEGADEGSR